MAPTQAKNVAVDFNQMIRAGTLTSLCPMRVDFRLTPLLPDREKRKNETLAREIFGRNRRQSAPVAGAGIRKPGSGGSLASRIGAAKPAQRVSFVSRIYLWSHS